MIAASAPKSKLLALISTVGTFSKGLGNVTTVEILLSPKAWHISQLELDGRPIVPLLKTQERVSRGNSNRAKRETRVCIQYY